MDLSAGRIIDRSVLGDSPIRTRRSPLPPGEGLGGEAGVSRTMVRAGRTASACMPMRALQVRDERVVKLGTLDRSDGIFAQTTTRRSEHERVAPCKAVDAAFCTHPGGHRTSRRRNISDPPDPHDRAVVGRRSGGCHRTHPGSGIRRGARAADRGRQPRRRGRPDRVGSGRQGDARWLHAAVRLLRAARDRAAAQCIRRAIRFAQGFRADFVDVRRRPTCCWSIPHRQPRM